MVENDKKKVILFLKNITLFFIIEKEYKRKKIGFFYRFLRIFIV